MEKKQIVLTADIGGTHITSAQVDLCNRKIIPGTILRSEINSLGTAETIIDEISNNLNATLSKCSAMIHGIGIAMPGPMDYDLGICRIREQGKFFSLYNLDLKALLAEKLSIEMHKINFINDAAAFLQGEIFAGSLKNSENSLGITLGTGLGSAHAVKQNAEDSNLWCMPFRSGIAEDYLSSRWFIERFYELSGIRAVNVYSLISSQRSATFLDQLFCEFKVNLAHFIDMVCSQKEVSSVVLGGNISLAEEFFVRGTKDILKHYYKREVAVQRSKLGEEATLFGAAMICC
ncbi:ROK family protein [Pedobacter sp. UBA5917]|jgi:glucokinase|uniref:ROK family protein n=1 Tax=Pedobacter sp. UBA5917 TaxID=1947061 RepID=UPI0025EF32F3|nr:ROK family protein [Pedobacter sp. UBA5917]